MVKGVNRQIIEINDTNNRYFERVLLFVSPEGSDLNSHQLSREAKEFMLRLTPEQASGEGIRSRMIRRRRRNRMMWGGGIATVVISAILIVLIVSCGTAACFKVYRVILRWW